MNRAVVFAYHNVGVRCLSVLIAQGIDIPLVITHADSPGESIWFDSVARLAALHDIPVITPLDPNAPEIVARVQAARPDFLFSFYYRNLLKKALLNIPAGGAFNMHGSLLPKYRGRVPVNWAIIKGETQTGATLHVMNEKPDNGAIVAAQAVPILPDDTALNVFHKVTCAAEMVLYHNLPKLCNGTVVLTPQDLSQSSYFGGRNAEDGRIDWAQSAKDIHNLVRAVAPPYPGAFSTLEGKPMRIFRTRIEPNQVPRASYPAFYGENERCYAVCADGRALRILEMEFNAEPVDIARLAATLGKAILPLSR